MDLEWMAWGHSTVSTAVGHSLPATADGHGAFVTHSNLPQAP
jgi:hypothetical protein